MPTTKKISELPLATGPTGSAVVPLVEGGVTKRVQLTELRTVSYVTDSEPSASVQGSLWYAPTLGRLHIAYGGAWVHLASANP